MDSSDHIYPRADKASREVDSFVLASALDHIAKVAAKSHTQTRRIRWIQARAENALAGKEHCDLDIDLPCAISLLKSAIRLLIRIRYLVRTSVSSAVILASLLF